MKFVSNRVKQYLKNAKDFCVYKVLHADDPPHRLALGIAIGVFVTFTPLIGLQMVLSIFLAWLLGANKIVGVPIVWISNPFTIVPIYYPCYVVGCRLTGTPVLGDAWEQTRSSWELLLRDPSTRWLDKVAFWWSHLLEFMGPLWIGCTVVALTSGVACYYVSLYGIRSYRLRRWGQLMPPKSTPVESIEDDQVARKKSAKGENAA